MTRRVFRHVVIVAWLTTVWVALWEEFTVANVVGGVGAAIVILLMLPPRQPGPVLGFRPVAAVWLLIFFSWKLVEASARLAWEVVTPRNKINAAIVAVPLATESHAIATMVANMVSLTPGTLTLEAREDPLTLFIHVLHLKSFEAERASVHQLERLCLRAFPELGRRRAVDRKVTP